MSVNELIDRLVDGKRGLSRQLAALLHNSDLTLFNALSIAFCVNSDDISPTNTCIQISIQQLLVASEIKIRQDTY